MKRDRVPRSPIVSYDVTVGKYDDFPEFNIEQLARRTEINDAALNLFKVLAEDRHLSSLAVDYDWILEIVDLAAEHLATDKGLAIYYPEYRKCKDAYNKSSKVNYIQNYYN